MQDHMQNYIRVKLMGGKFYSKPNIVPHIFDCQPSRTTAATLAPRSAVRKRQSGQLLLDAFSSVEDANNSMCQTDSSETEEEVVRDVNEVEQEPRKPLTRDIGVQCKPSFRSRYTMCTSATIGLQTHAQTSPMKGACVVSTSCGPSSSSTSSLTVEMVYTDFSSEESQGETEEDDKEYEDTASATEASGEEDDDIVKNAEEERMKAESLNITRYNTMKNPFRYLGLPDNCKHLVDSISKSIQYRGVRLEARDVVLLVLRKIRLNESFGVVADNFGICKSHAAAIFSNFTPVVANCLQQLVVWPEAEIIRRLLPVAFQARYNKVQSIMDCFEIEIEKPTKAVHQALTWSEYKKANTSKYLMSATPDGITNFVSSGYGARVSDMVLLEDSGFKQIGNLIVGKKYRLMRPHSVSAGEKISATQCKETKRIASLKIHIERHIRRFREFKPLTPHACLDIHLLNKIDDCVLIAAGLINLQGSIIK